MRLFQTRIGLYAVAAGLALANSSQAGYTGLTVERYTTVSIGGVNHDVWRLYASFSDPGDRLVAGTSLRIRHFNLSTATPRLDRARF